MQKFLPDSIFLLSGKFITVMNMHVLPVHKQYIKYSSVLLAFYDSSMVKHREVRAVSFSKMKMNIVIFITTVNLFPDAGFYLFLLILPNQVMEAFICKSERVRPYLYIRSYEETPGLHRRAHHLLCLLCI